MSVCNELHHHAFKSETPKDYHLIYNSFKSYFLEIKEDKAGKGNIVLLLNGAISYILDSFVNLLKDNYKIVFAMNLSKKEVSHILLKSVLEQHGNINRLIKKHLGIQIESLSLLVNQIIYNIHQYAMPHYIIETYRSFYSSNKSCFVRSITATDLEPPVHQCVSFLVASIILELKNKPTNIK